MQGRICQIDETLLQRTAGPYIRVRPGNPQAEHIESASPQELTPTRIPEGQDGRMTALPVVCVSKSR
jgi:hypothetical protein